MPENATVLRSSQWGLESTPGTAVAADKRLMTIGVLPTPATRIVPYRPVGRKYSTTAVKGKEHTTAAITGVLDYNAIIYLLAGLMKTPTPTTPTGATNTRNWQFLPSTTAADATSTFTIETGNSTEAERFAYGLMNGLSLNITENPPIEITGTMLGWTLTEGITLTPTPTVISESPVDPSSVSVFVGSATTNEVQTLTLAGATGSYGLTFTDPYGVSAATGLVFTDASTNSAIQTALRGLTNIGGDNVTVTGSAGGPYTITFSGLFAGLNVTALAINAGTLSGGAPAVTTPTPGGLTLLTRCLETTFNYNDRFTPEFTLDASVASFSAHVEKAPTFDCQLILQHDATVSVAMMADLRARTTKYLHIACVGPSIETGFNRMLTIRFPFKFVESTRADHNDVWGATYTLAPMDDGTSVIEVNVRNTLTGL